MNEDANYNSIKSCVIQQLNKNKDICTEAYIINLIDQLRRIMPISDAKKEQMLKEIESLRAIKMDVGTCLISRDHKPWYAVAKKEMDQDFWNRYYTYLDTNLGFSPNVIDSLDRSTDEMMDLLGNPNLSQGFSRRGLVIGDVQSGKTATYTALMNKAADAGYKVIILLTGMIEKLRCQTQTRIDEGFIGFDSTKVARDNNKVHVGVGLLGSKVYAVSMTSTVSDFNKKSMQQFGARISTFNGPVVFVLKKNKKVLESLESWLKGMNAIGGGQIDEPMLLIDDEADNASVNTNREDLSPTAINSAIRSLLGIFSKTSYVGFTATPYANIFINPDSTDEMIKDDLFPRDFIYVLTPPSNYVGASSIFLENGKHAYMLHHNDDCEEFIPEKHKKDLEISFLPPSLYEAIASFFIVNAIRDLRGDTCKHRTMMVNVSRFINVQEQISDKIDSSVRRYQRIFKNYGALGDLNHKEIAFVKSVFDKNYSSIKKDDDSYYTWEEVCSQMAMSILPIVVKPVNAGNAVAYLNYEDHEKDGLRLIAVGGISLSRGLTLEGLCISYYHRNSKMYDTMMQMGRWFGYRTNYEDLCQVWMNAKSIRWYNFITEASEDLKREIIRMKSTNKTPLDFGLGIREGLDFLLVTANNKMRRSGVISRYLNYSGEVFETPYLLADRETNLKNYEHVTQWLEGLLKKGFQFERRTSDEPTSLYSKKPQILNVGQKSIIELLENFSVNSSNFKFNIEDTIKILRMGKVSLEKWDVVIANGVGKEISWVNEKVKLVKRSFTFNENARGIQLSGDRSRLGSPSDGRAGLTNELYNKIIEYNENNGIKTTTRSLFTSDIKRNPLLIIYPIELNVDDYDGPKKEIIKSIDFPIIGLSIGIPIIPGEQTIRVDFRCNSRKIVEFATEYDDYGNFDDYYDEDESEETGDIEVGIV